jgi:MobA/MobL family protein
MTAASWYHCQLKPIGRGAGRSAVACAAYRAGELLMDERYGRERDFSRKRGVVTSFSFAADDAPAWARDVERLWNAVEAHEKRKDAQLAFEWEVALPASLSDAEREAIARKFTGWLVQEYGVAGSVGIHSGEDRGNGLNDHMHVMMTTRGVDEEGFAAKKLRQFSTRPGAKNPEVDKVKECAADLINEALEEADSDERVDHRSYKARGIDREGTRHLGPAATAYERRGMETHRGDLNRDRQERNRDREIIEERLADQRAIVESLQAELARQLGEPAALTGPAERDLAARFGEDREHGGEEHGPEQPAATTLGPEQSAQGERGAERAAPSHQPGEQPQRETPWGYAWRAFADRARAFAARLEELWQNESSGGAGSWVSRVRLAKDAVAAILSRGENRRAVAELGRELGEEIAHDLTAAAQAPPPDPKQDPRSGRAWGEMEQKRRQERGKEPDDKAPERPADPLYDPVGAAFDAAMSDSPEPSEPGVEDWLEAPPPPAAAPEPEPDETPEPDGPDMN